MEQVKKDKKKYSIFNDEWKVVEDLGKGHTARVFLCEKLKDPSEKVALKLIRQEFLKDDQSHVKTVEQEISILHGLDHNNVTKIIGYGSDGKIVKASGKEITNLIYIMLEYIPGGVFFDMVKSIGGMGEDAGRFFMEQFIDVLQYMSKKKVAHRDLKLENILVEEDLNLKVADFGFATYKNIGKLKSYRGTKTYMAPEIKEGKTYDGRKVDMFSVGVIIFIVVQGTFPFQEARKEEQYYNLLYSGKHQKYWKKTGGAALSDDFKDLITKMMSYNPDDRPSVEELKDHPWMKGHREEEVKEKDRKRVRKQLQQLLKESNYEKSTEDTESTKQSNI